MGTQAMEVMQEGDGHPLPPQGKLLEFLPCGQKLQNIIEGPLREEAGSLLR